MKTLKIVFTVLLCPFFCPLYFSVVMAATIYRPAQPSDLSAILKLQKKYTPGDRAHLLSIPGPHGESHLARELNAHHLFVAQDEETQEIWAMVKLYLVKENDLSGIMNEEVRATGSKTHLIGHQTYDLRRLRNRPGFLAGKNRPLVACEGTRPGVIRPDLSQHIILYYGGAYTVPKARGTGMHTRLTQYALRSVRSDFRARITPLPPARKIIFAYCQVLANQSHRGMIYQFSNYVKKLSSLLRCENSVRLSPVVHQYSYLTFKPEFSLAEDGSTLNVQFPEANRGTGNLLVFSLKGAGQ